MNGNKQRGEVDSTGRQGLEVLVVDDDAEIRELLAEFFRERRLRVATAPDGRAAVAALARSEGRHLLVLADIAMPGADGFAVLTAARAATPPAYVVMMTGYASLDSAITAERLGAQDYLTKPFSLGQLDVILQRVNARFATDAAPSTWRRAMLRRNCRASAPGSRPSSEVAAGNLANIDTPGYRSRDVAFGDMLAGEIQKLALARPGGTAVAGVPADAPETTQVAGLQSRRDGNNVQLDRELLNMTQASADFAAAQTVLAAKFRLIRYAINEGR